MLVPNALLAVWTIVVADSVRALRIAGSVAAIAWSSSASALARLVC